MEASGEDLGLLNKIRPPRLEDAGLEDCALPPDSIKEAFLKAASAVGSRAASVFAGDDDGGCISDPWPVKIALSDALVVVEPESENPVACITGKGAALGGDDVVVVGERNEKKDDVVVVGGVEGVSGGECVDGLMGLEIKGKEKEKGQEQQEHGEKKPTLVEGYFLNP